MQIRVKNLNKGSRGLYVDSSLVFVDGGSTGTFTGATAEERDAAANLDGLKVQSRLGESGDWTDHFKEEMPLEKPWFAIMSGADFKPLPELDGNWMIGMAVASERPDAMGGYKWVKVGGGLEAGKVATPEPVPVKPVVQTEPDPVEPVKNDEPVAVDYAELVKGNAPDVIAAVTKDNAMDIGAAEEKREGGPRKGVMKAVEEAIG